MKSVIALSFLALSTQVLGRAASVEKRNMFVPSWELEVTPGGEKVTLNGTVQEVHAQLLKLNPNWNEDFSFNKSSSSSDLVKRTNFDPSDEYYCGGRFEGVGITRNFVIEDGIAYLRGIGGVPTAPSGSGGWCSRVSCAYDAAITWCNDDPAGKSLYSFGSIADGAQFILDMCQESLDNDGIPGTSGQVFHPTNWNVIVDSQAC